jgi:hypothetical protein
MAKKKMSNYKYRQLRKVVKSAKVRAPVKELLFCTLKDYYNQSSVPADGVFQEGKSRCLIGAAVHDKTILKNRLRDINVDEHTAWVEAAKEAFNVKDAECDDIITGFDTSDELKGNVYTRVTKIANQLRGELIGFDKDDDEDYSSDWY